MNGAAATLPHSPNDEESSSDNGSERLAEAIKAEYEFYCDDVKRWIDMVEVCFDHVPDGLSYEVRAFTGHIGDAITRSDQTIDERLDNVNSAHTHLRRIILDCLKLVGIWQRDQFNAFDRKYRWSDLSEVNNGTFTSEYATLKKTAIDAFKRAKAAERPGKNDRGSEDSEDVYDLYLKAFNANVAVLNFLEGSSVAVNRAASRSKRGKVFAYIGYIAGIVGAVLTCITFIYPYL